MVLGVGTMVGGIILHFAEKADRFVHLPVAIVGKLVIVLGML